MAYEIGTCLPEDLPELIALANRVFRPRGDGDMGREYPLLLAPDNASNLHVARHEGRVVSHVGLCVRDAVVLGASLRVGLIGAVATDPDHRGRGLASDLMSSARESAAAQGASLLLISGGRGLYHRLGYVEVGPFDVVDVSRDLPAGPFGVEPAGIDSPDATARLHQAEPVRFVRPLQDWRRLLAAGMLMNQPAELFLVRHGDDPVAYLAVLRRSDRDGRLVVLEHGGSREAVARAGARLAFDQGALGVRIVCRPDDADWNRLRGMHRFVTRRIHFGGTLGVIDPVRFIEAVRPLIEERAGNELKIMPHGEGAILETSAGAAELGRMGELTAAIFGGDTEEARVPAGRLAPLGPVVSRALPLPLPWYGYNYV